MADVTYENALKAMRIAHEKGDTDAAKKMARLAKTLQGGVQEAPRSQAMTQVNTGIAQGLGGAIDAVNPFDGDEFSFSTGSAVDGIKSVMQRAGVETTDEEAANAWEAIQRGTGEALSLAPVYGKIFQVLSKAPGQVGKIAASISGTLTPSSVSTGSVARQAGRNAANLMPTAAEGVAGGLAAGGAQAAEDAGAGPVGQTLAAFAAPLTAAGAVAAGRQALRFSPTANAIKAAGRQIAPFTTAGAREVARQRMQTLSGGPQRAEELAARTEVENPLNLTPAQQTQDRNLMGLEAVAADQDPALRGRLEARQQETQNLAESDLRSRGGTPEDQDAAEAYIQKRRTEFKSYLDGAVDRAYQRAQERIDGLGPSRSEEANSAIVTREIDEALKTAKSEEDRLYSLINRDETAPTSNARAVAQQIDADTGRAKKGNIPAEVRQLLLDEGGFESVETVREIYDLYSQLRMVARNEMAGTQTNPAKAGIANKIADALLEDLGAAAGSTPQGRLINDARTYSREMHETFDRGATGDILTRTIDGDTRIEPELALDRTVGRGGLQGEVARRQIEGATNAVADDAVQDYVKLMFQRGGRNRSGEFTVKDARAFIAKNKPLMDAFPKLRDDILGGVEGYKSADDFAAKVSKMVKTYNAQPGARVVDGTLSRAVDAVFSAANPVKAAASLAREARQDGSGAALDGIKGAVLDKLINQSARGSGDSKALSGVTLENVLTDRKTAATLSRFFNSEEIKRMRVIARELKKAANTDAANLAEISEAAPSTIIELLARTQAARIGGAQGGGSMGGSLQTANIAVGRAQRILDNLFNDKASVIMADAIENPELFRALLRDGRSVKQVEASMKWLAPYLVGSASAVEAEQE